MGVYAIAEGAIQVQLFACLVLTGDYCWREGVRGLPEIQPQGGHIAAIDLRNCDTGNGPTGRAIDATGWLT